MDNSKQQRDDYDQHNGQDRSQEIKISLSLVVWEPSEEDKKKASTEEQRLEIEARAAIAELASIQNKLTDLDDKLQSENQIQVDELVRLQQELHEIFAQQALEKAAFDNLGDTDLDGDDFQERLNAHVEREAPVKSKPSAKLKDLYKKIALKTHPDRTDDKDKHDLFRAARICLDKNDYEGMVLIWESVKGNAKNGSSLLKSLMNRLEALREQVLETRRKVEELKNSDPYKMWVDYQVESTKHRVNEHFRQMIQAQISQAKDIIRGMDPTRYPQQPNFRTIVINGVMFRVPG